MEMIVYREKTTQSRHYLYMEKELYRERGLYGEETT